MTTGHNRPKRPAYVVGNAIKVARIATGEEEDEFEPRPGWMWWTGIIGGAVPAILIGYGMMLIAAE
jgi:hypothetical protein